MSIYEYLKVICPSHPSTQYAAYHSLLKYLEWLIILQSLLWCVSIMNLPCLCSFDVLVLGFENSITSRYLTLCTLIFLRINFDKY